MKLSDIIIDSKKQFAKNIALDDSNGSTLNYLELAEKANIIKHFLEDLGIEKEDRVAIYLKKSKPEESFIHNSTSLTVGATYDYA